MVYSTFQKGLSVAVQGTQICSALLCHVLAMQNGSTDLLAENALSLQHCVRVLRYMRHGSFRSSEIKSGNAEHQKDSFSIAFIYNLRFAVSSESRTGHVKRMVGEEDVRRSRSDSRSSKHEMRCSERARKEHLQLNLSLI
jgi:hypothetical protein